MLPVNLLALDSAHFDANSKAGQGIQPPETGFGVAFGSLMRVPDASAGPLLPFPPGSDAPAGWPVSGGEVLPQTGNRLPPGGAGTLREIELTGGEILADISVPEAPTPAMNLQDAGVQVTPASIESGGPAFPAGMAGAPADAQATSPVAALPVASPEVDAAEETRARADTAHSGLLQHIRYLEPGTLAQTRPVADTGPSVSLQRPDSPLIARPLPTNPQVTTGTPEFALQATGATRTSSASMPPGTEVLLPGDVQDLKAAQPHALSPSIATIKTSSAAAAAPSMQWTSIDVAPGQAGWNEALGDRVTWMAGNKIQNAELRLNPADLGPVRVQISMDDGKASVTFTAQHPLTRDAIEQALPRLREMLADQGLSLQNASVSDHGSRHQQAGTGGERVAPQFGSAAGTDGGMVEGQNVSPVVRTPSGLVDVFA